MGPHKLGVYLHPQHPWDDQGGTQETGNWKW